MKPHVSLPIRSTLKTWLTGCAFGVTLLGGLPLTALAQDATILNQPETIASASHARIYVNHTKWLVEYAENGRNGDYHAVPWLFLPNGTVRAGTLWQGTWQVQSPDTIRVVLRMNDSGAMDQFDVTFNSPFEFTAYKDGHAYRYAVRQ